MRLNLLLVIRRALALRGNRSVGDMLSAQLVKSEYPPSNFPFSPRRTSSSAASPVSAVIKQKPREITGNFPVSEFCHRAFVTDNRFHL